MANPFQQKARQRKIIYLVLVVALFTGSLLHRRFIVEKQAEDLQLRETARGEVELTSSFVRVSLTGSRGLATTLLWMTAIDRMTRHEWNELELLVASISKLQPHFITPWVFQSWNLAFNVAVECDRPRDKYYYISRGLELLAEGERRNQGTMDLVPAGSDQRRFPGNPEMRYYMGFYYQLKIGMSDEKKTMRCLLDLSCIDPLDRNPDKFWDTNERGQRVIKTKAMEKLCQDHPRLVRRLREQMGYENPTDIVKFLEDNKDVPSRFKKSTAPDQKQSELEEPRRQFPILPPVTPRSNVDGTDWPKPLEYQWTQESMDVFLLCRTWYQYAQEPLPPALQDPGVPDKEREHRDMVEKIKQEKRIIFRNAKAMAEQIFRAYPARAQGYMAENLETEGWFDGGWVIEGPSWFEPALTVGTEAKYLASPAWDKAYNMYRDFGIRNGLYLSAAEVAELDRKAEPIRAKYKINRYKVPPLLRDDQRAELGESFNAHMKIAGSLSVNAMTNFDAQLSQCDAERDPQTVLARKLLYQATLFNRSDRHEALALYEQAWPLWIDTFLKYPAFALLSNVQDEVYEPEIRYMRLNMDANPGTFRAAMLATAPMAIAPHPNWPTPANWPWAAWPYWDAPEELAKPFPAAKGPFQPMIDPSQKTKMLTVRVTLGPLEQVVFYTGPEAEAVRDYWFRVSYLAGKVGQLGVLPPVVLPGQSSYALAGSTVRLMPDPPMGWQYIISADTITGVRGRFGLLRPPQEKESGPPTPISPVSPVPGVK